MWGIDYVWEVTCNTNQCLIANVHIAIMYGQHTLYCKTESAMFIDWFCKQNRTSSAHEDIVCSENWWKDNQQWLSWQWHRFSISAPKITKWPCWSSVLFNLWTESIEMGTTNLWTESTEYIDIKFLVATRCHMFFPFLRWHIC